MFNSQLTRFKTDAANDILSSRPNGYQDSLETGIEYRKFARALERLQTYRQGTKKDLDIASVLPEFDAVCFTRYWIASETSHLRDEGSTLNSRTFYFLLT